MANKLITLDGIGEVSLIKRKGSRSIRLSISGGNVRVSLPSWTPFAAGAAFARAHASWIERELTKQKVSQITPGQRIGKLHAVRYEQVQSGTTSSTRVSGTEIVVRVQPGEVLTDPAVQERAYAACIRALKREAAQLLPPRVHTLATKHGKHCSGVSVKQLKRRWGSCDNHQAIVLNLFLMELPWEYIDYVILHELAHTEQMNHGPDFWQVLMSMQPKARDQSIQLRKRQPTIGAWQQNIFQD